MKKATMKAVQDRIEARLFREAKEAVKALEDFKQNGRDLTLLLNKGIDGEALKVRQELLNNAAPLNAPPGYRPVQMLVEYPIVALQGQVKAMVSSNTKKRVIAEDKVCRWCMERPARTVDHVLPRSRGGSNVAGNLVGSCLECNQAKGDFIPRELGWVLHLPLRAFG